MIQRVFAFVLAVGLCLTSLEASGHFSVVRSTPAAGQSLGASPKRLQVWFTQPPAPGVSHIALLGEDDKDRPIGKTQLDKNTKSMFAELPAPLGAGAYRFTWRTAGDDGHVLSGEIRFTVAPKAGR